MDHESREQHGHFEAISTPDRDGTALGGADKETRGAVEWCSSVASTKVSPGLDWFLYSGEFGII